LIHDLFEQIDKATACNETTAERSFFTRKIPPKRRRKRPWDRGKRRDLSPSLQLKGEGESGEVKDFEQSS